MTYRSEAGAAAVRHRYRELLDRWPIPHQELRIPTGLGERLVVVSGPPDAPPVMLCTGPFVIRRSHHVTRVAVPAPSAMVAACKRSRGCDDRPMNEQVGRAYRLIEANRYLTLATADLSGRPWASTVWYTLLPRASWQHGFGVEPVWLSRPEARHSRNLTQRPEVGISIFDSRQPPDAGQGLQLAAVAEQVRSPQLDKVVAAFSLACVAAGGDEWTRAQVEEPALPRLYIARISSAFLLGEGSRVELPLA